MAKAIVDMRKAAANITITVQTKNGWMVQLGILIIRLGCRVGGFGFVEEFPMSLIQPKKHRCTCGASKAPAFMNVPHLDYCPVAKAKIQ